jgi:hypothetical protein
MAAAGCAAQTESYTARTGVEQMLISSAVDKSLAKIDFTPLQYRKVYLDTRYLDCTDKNYVIVAMHRQLMNARAALVDKADEAEIIVEVASGAVGTNGQEQFVGVPEIPLAPCAAVSSPRLSLFSSSQMNGTAKLLVIAFDAKTRQAVINSGCSLARSDQKALNFMGTGTVETGSVSKEIAAAAARTESKKAVVSKSQPAPAAPEIRTVSFASSTPTPPAQEPVVIVPPDDNSTPFLNPPIQGRSK